MFRKVGVVLLFAALFGACSSRKGPERVERDRQVADWEVIIHGVVESVGDDYIVVHFYRVTVEGTGVYRSATREQSILPIIKVFKALERDRTGLGINYPLSYKPGDSTFLNFEGLLGVTFSWLIDENVNFLREATQSELPSLSGFRAGQGR